MRTQTVDRPFTHAGIDLVVSQYKMDSPKVYPGYVDTQDNRNESYWRVAQEGDMPPASVINQATGINYEDFSTGNYKDYFCFKRGVGFAIPTERMDTDFYKLMNKRGKKMAKALELAIEIDMAGFFNLATSSTFLCPDGVCLASASHPIDNGLASNIVTGNPPLSYTALATAYAQFQRELTQAGNYNRRVGPFRLIIGTAGPVDTAYRLARTRDGMPGSADHDKPWANVEMLSGDPVIVPWITSTTAWMLVDASDNPMTMINRRDFKSNEQYDQDRDIDKWAATQIWGRGLKDWRGVLFSAGA